MTRITSTSFRSIRVTRNGSLVIVRLADISSLVRDTVTQLECTKLEPFGSKTKCSSHLHLLLCTFPTRPANSFGTMTPAALKAVEYFLNHYVSTF